MRVTVEDLRMISEGVPGIACENAISRAAEGTLEWGHLTSACDIDAVVRYLVVKVRECGISDASLWQQMEDIEEDRKRGSVSDIELLLGALKVHLAGGEAPSEC